MGEYIKISGESTKIGTCENLYYTTFEALKKALPFAKKEEGNDDPANYLVEKHGYRYRFPFPDEDDKAIGTHENYDRGQLFTISREKLPEDFCKDWPEITGRLYSETQKNLSAYAKAENPNNTAPYVNFEIVQQKQSNGKLCAIFRDPYSGNKFRIEDDEDIIPICAAISETYLNSFNKNNFDYYDEFLKRLMTGYNLPYTSKKEVLQEKD